MCRYLTKAAHLCCNYAEGRGNHSYVYYAQARGLIGIHDTKNKEEDYLTLYGVSLVKVKLNLTNDLLLFKS